MASERRDTVYLIFLKIDAAVIAYERPFLGDAMGVTVGSSVGFSSHHRCVVFSCNGWLLTDYIGVRIVIVVFVGKLCLIFLIMI